MLFRGNDRFEVIRRIGAGNMGVVYEARDRDQRRQVALKTLHDPRPDALLRLKREFRALRDLSHRNLVSLGELIEEGGTWFFTMELIAGQSFLDWIRSPGEPGFDERRLRDGFAQLTAGLAALHERGKVHRDVKPSNVLVDGDGRVVLIDLGLVTDPDRVGRATSDGLVIGTIAYMAPEQAASKAVGPPADWYGVGVLLYEALTGQLPFDGPPLQVMFDKQGTAPESPSQVRAGIPPDLDALCMELLDPAPERRPSPGELLRRLGRPRTSASHASQGHSLSPVFVGRSAELAILETAFDDSRHRAVTVAIEGESGVGKSAVAKRFADLVSARPEVLVLAGRCYEAESVPYKAFDGIIDVLAHFMQRLPRGDAAALVPPQAALLAQVFPTLRQVEVLAELPPAHGIDPQELRVRMFAALRELLIRLAARGPLVLLIDDLQWADDDSGALLTELQRPPNAPRMLLVCTQRPGTGLQVAPHGELRTVALAPLGRADGHALARRLVEQSQVPAGAAELLADTITLEADGNPLFIGELARFAVSHQGGALAARMPERLDEVILSRVAQLDDATRRVLRTIAVAGGPVEQQVAARASRLDIAAFVPIASQLRVANLVRTSGVRMADAIEPFHDRVREAVSASVDAEARRDIHRELARAYQALGREPAEAIALHLHGAGDDEGAARYAIQAAGQAMQALAFDRAVRLYRLALRTSRAGVAEQRALRIQLGDALASAGHGRDAAREYLAAGRDASPGEVLDLQRLAAQQLFVTGHTEEALVTVREVLAASGMTYPATPRRALLAVILRRARLRLRGYKFKRRDPSEIAAADLARMDVCWHVGLGLGLVDVIRGHAFMVQGLLLALRTGEPYRFARSLAVEAGYVSSGGGKYTAQVEELLAEAGRIATEMDHPHLLALTAGCRGVALFLFGRFAESARVCDEGEAILRERCARLPWELATMRLFSARSLHYMGEFQEVARRVPYGIAECRGRGDLFGETSLRVTVMPFLWLYKDDPDAAAHEANDAMARWPATGYQMPHYYQFFSLCHVDLYRGDAEAALKRITDGVPRLEQALLWRVQIVKLSTLDVRARAHLMAAQGGDRDRHLRAAEADAGRIEAEKMPWATPLATAIRASVALGRGDRDAAIRLYTDAEDGLRAAGLAVHAAAARAARGTVLGGAAGDALVAEVQQWLSDREVRRPERVIAMLMPTARASTAGTAAG